MIVELNLTEAQCLLIGYVLERALLVMEYDREDKVYRSNDDFVIQLDAKEYKLLKRLATKVF